MKTNNSAAYALLKRRPIAVNPALIKLTDSHTAAIFLSQAIYWEETVGREYYKTNEDWQKELYMSEQVFATARKKASKYISVVKKGLPARNFYKVNWDVLLEDLDTLVTGVSSQLENYPHQSPQKVGSLDTPESGVTITETTSKTTSKTNNTNNDTLLKELLNKVTGRNFRVLPNGYKKTLKEFTLEEIEKALLAMKKDKWHSERWGSLKSDYLIRSSTIDNFLNKKSSGYNQSVSAEDLYGDGSWMK